MKKLPHMDYNMPSKDTRKSISLLKEKIVNGYVVEYYPFGSLEMSFRDCCGVVVSNKENQKPE